MASLDLFLFHEFGLTSLTNVQEVSSLTMPLSSLMMPAYSDADLLFFLQEIVYKSKGRCDRLDQELV